MSEEGSFGRAPAIVKPIYFFDEADGRNKMLLGGKGAGLAEMTKLGLPVPPGFIITTEICEKFYEAGKRLPDGLMDEVRKSIRRLEGMTGKKFGDSDNPAAGVGALGRADVYAGHDGDHPQPRAQRPDGRGPGKAEQRLAVCVGRIPALYPDVWQDSAWSRRQEI